MFSSRLPRSLEQNRFAGALTAAKASGRRLYDLTVTNPTAVGIAYPPDLLAGLSAPGASAYEPHPLGLARAREAVAADYHRRGISVASERIVLTASTSEAYSMLFKLLCEPAGDAVMVPVPSYPLFDHLTALDGVSAVPYLLDYHGRWMVDFDHLDAQWASASVRALLAVSPNNPTGSVLSPHEIAALSSRCADGDAAFILDEVFADYPLGIPSADSSAERRPFDAAQGRPEALDGRAPSAESGADPLSFRLGGLSKSVGLPQVKLGWIAVQGPDALVRQAMERLELIADTYLSVSTPVQVAAPALLEKGARVRAAIQQRTRENYAALRATVAAHPSVQLLEADAGWSAVVRVPAHAPEEQIVLALLEQDDVVVHPGFFFDFAHEAFLVLSLLPEPGVFREGLRRMLDRVHG